MGAKFKDAQQPIKLMIENSNTSGVRPLAYTFEVASDTNFSSKVFGRGSVPPGGDGKTSVQIDRLEIGRTYYWRVRAEDGANSGPFLTAQFEVLPKPFISAPTPTSPVNNEVVASRTADAARAQRRQELRRRRPRVQIPGRRRARRSRR